MAAKEYLTYDGDALNAIVPHRPGIDDLGGDELIDHQEFPPDPETMPTADAWNQKVGCIAAQGKVLPSAIIGVRFNAGAPVVEFFSSVSSSLDASDVGLTDNGAG